MLKEFTKVATAVGATTKKLEKERLVGEYLKTLDDGSLERAVVFLSGSPFPRKDERVTGVGWSSIADAAAGATGADLSDLADAAVTEGDLGDGLARFFPEDVRHDLTILELGEVFDELAATQGSSAKIEILTRTFKRVNGDEARFIAKILQNEIRIGLQEGLVESAIAKAFGRKLQDVRRANMFTADLGVTALLAKSGTLDQAAMTLFHPLGFMLAQPEETAAGIFEQLGAKAIVDDKYDGIRAQIHYADSKVKIYSRTLDEITERFPEVAEAAEKLPTSLILDGEIVAFDGRILPFAILQKRIGRRKLTEKTLAASPVVFFAFDLLYVDGKPIFEQPLTERLAQLDRIVSAEGVIRRAYTTIADSPEAIDAAFDEARRRANEGLVLKAPDSIYTPGRRGKSWLKYKKALATLDCVVTAAQYGNGKRRKLLSDYTFAIRVGDELMNIGKAYSGVTDAEIDRLTALFKEITIAQYGPVHVVKPQVVFEIAFDRIQESSRHKSGYAMRFPRIARIRDDKSVDEISTIDDVRRIVEGQNAREEGE
jgi:DNA ligase 1